MKQQPKLKKKEQQKKILSSHTILSADTSRFYFEYRGLQMGMSVPKIRYVTAK